MYEGWSESSRKKLPFLHRLIHRAGITVHNTATHMQFIGYNMLDVSRLRALKLSSRQRYIARTCPFYVVFWRFTTQPIKLQCFVKCCCAVIANIAFHAYLTAYLNLFHANFQRIISNGWCSKSKRITVLSKRQSIQLLWTHCLFWHLNSLKWTIYTLRKTPFFRWVDLILIVKSDIIIIGMNTDKKISFLFKIYKNSKNWRILGLPFRLKPINLNT